MKTTGDGLLLEFPSVVDAVRCMIQVQTETAAKVADMPEDCRITFRVGVNIGDIIIDGDDIFGDGVNVAARLQEIAAPGGMCVSSRVHDDVRDRLEAIFEDGGSQTLKNIARPVQVWHWASGSGSALEPVRPALAVPDRPSIAVLPFQNMSGDPEQEYFADGVVEDIITALSRFKSLFVIARNSSFTYKGKAVDIKQVGRELGVRYVLEGSVRKAGGRIRVTGQLIDSQTGTHLWADRFEGKVEDVFDLQDQVTASVIGQIAPKIEHVEIERIRSKPTKSLSAYETYLRGMACLYRETKESMAEALAHFYRAIELDPDFAAAYSGAVLAYNRRKQGYWMADIEHECREGVRLGRKAVELQNDDAFALCMAGYAVAYLGGEPKAGVHFMDRALQVNPNSALTWHCSGWIRCYIGDHETAIEHFAQAARLSPLDPQMSHIQLGTSLALCCAGHYEESVSWAEAIARERPDFLPAIVRYAIGNALAGRLDEARKAMTRALQIKPNLTISTFASRSVLQRSEDLAKQKEALRLAGLAE